MSRKTLLILTLIITSTVFTTETIFAKSAKAKATKIVATKNITQAKITFIELGSVRCMPCKMMEPIIEEIKKEFPQVRVVFHDVWTDAGAPYAEQYQIRSIPTQIFLDKNGQEYARHTGFFPKAELIKVLNAGLNK